ncbi:MAG: hypothetical protein H6735_32130 [Alphaproteobacteria bacterium]|nr:hypothetical protein [Alphaproteobacteria bacterium]
MKVPGQFPLGILVGLAACTWFAVAVALYGASPDLGFFKPMTLVSGFLALVLAGFDRWLWRIPGLVHVHGVPDLNGTWKGELRSMWIDPATGASPPPIPTFVVIRQTYTAISVRTFTVESSSVSIAAGLVAEPDGSLVLTYLFRNEPKLSVQDRSRLHHGGVKAALAGESDKLKGSYWTDRASKGELSLVRIDKKPVLDFESGQKTAERLS